MMQHRFALLMMTLITTASTKSNAQGSAGYDLFAFQGSRFRCVPTPVSARDSAQGIRIEMKFAEDDDVLRGRLIDVGYSATGEPLYLLTMANISAPDRPFSTDAAVVRFGPNSATTGIRIRPGPRLETLGASRADSIPAGLRALENVSPADGVRARALAVRLWNQRCLEGPTLPRP